MVRTHRQIDDDARAAADAIRTAERPMTAPELAEAMHRRGRPQTEKQAHTTATRAEELGLLRKRGRGAWDIPTDGVPPATAASTPVSTEAADLFVECAKRLLEMPPAPSFSALARTLLELATRHRSAAAPSRPAVSDAAGGRTTNGVGANDHREVEVLEPAHGD
jgi:hypothetical protein